MKEGLAKCAPHCFQLPGKAVAPTTSFLALSRLVHEQINKLKETYQKCFYGFVVGTDPVMNDNKTYENKKLNEGAKI